MTSPAGEPDDAISLFTRFLDLQYAAVLGEGSWAEVLKSLLALGAGGEQPHRRALFEAALRHVPHALAISRRLGSENQKTAVLECTAGSLPCGLVLLDARGAVLFASERANVLLRERQGVVVEGARLRSLRGLDDRNLTRALTRLLGNPGDSAGASCVDLPPQGRHSALRLLLMRAAAEGGGAGTVLMLAFGRDDTAALPGSDLLRDIYGFSAAEAELAGLLLAGQSLGEAARSRSVSMNTAKSQLRNVLRKTGSRNQADLMRVLIAGPAGLLQGLARPAAP